MMKWLLKCLPRSDLVDVHMKLFQKIWKAEKCRKSTQSVCALLCSYTRSFRKAVSATGGRHTDYQFGITKFRFEFSIQRYIWFYPKPYSYSADPLAKGYEPPCIYVCFVSLICMFWQLCTVTL